MTNIPNIKQDAILRGRICAYCEKQTELVDSKVVYGKSYGPIYYCRDCQAWVGCHKGTNKSLGRVAKGKLRNLKKEAHKYFDHMWKRRMNESKRMTKKKARTLAYKWLSEQMGTDPEYTHIGMYNEYQCERVIALCKPYYKSKRKNDG